MEKFQDEKGRGNLNSSALFHTVVGALFHTVKRARESLTVRFSTPSKAFSSFPTVRFSTPYIEYAILVCFFRGLLGIQRDEIAVETKRLMDENTEYKKRLNLAKGTEETGKVIVKGQSPGQSTQQPKATGKDLDAGMAAALKAERGA